MSTGSLLFPLGYMPLDDNGSPVPSGKLTFSRSGTSTAQDTYSDSTLSTANANPVVLDSAGRVSGKIYGDPASGYDYRVKFSTSADVQIWQHDDVKVASVASLTVQDNINSTVQAAIDNDSTGSSALARVAINSGDASIAMFAAGSAYSGTVVTGGPTGAQGVIRTLTGQPFLIATDNEARFRISQEIVLADDATGTFQVGEYGMVAVTSSFSQNAAVIVFMDGTSLVSVHTGSAAAVGTAGSNPDTDDRMDVWKSSSTVLSIKNRLGSSRSFVVTVLGNH